MLRSSFFWAGGLATLLRQRRKLVQQTTRTDCGVACALSVLNMLGRSSDPVTAVETMDPDRSGTDLNSLRRFFTDHNGLEAQAMKVPADKLAGMSGHLIVHMTQMHYLVVLRASRLGVLVFDPSMGPVFYPQADFAALYSGVLLQVSGRFTGQNLPVVRKPHPIMGGGFKRGIEPLALFVTGMASRLLECALLLCVVAVLYLVLNQSSFPSMLLAFALIAICGGVLVLTRQIRFEGEDAWIRKKQSRLWRDLMRTSLKGRDLHGFRGRYEREVAGSVRRGITVTIPQQAQIPATLGGVAVMTLALALLSPWLSLLYAALFGAVVVVTQLDSVQVCRRSVRGNIGRYSKLTHGNDLINSAAGPELIGEFAKWSVIGFAGMSVLTGSLPAVALMFWILTGMQIVPIDFRKAMVLAPVFSAREPVPALTGSEVPLRRQKVVGTVDLKATRTRQQLRIDGISPLTMTLQQPDLTVREQRLILADIVATAFRNLPEQDRPDIGPIRIFGPGQEASQADFEHLMIAREATVAATTLPVPVDTRKTLDSGLQDAVLRDLYSCDPQDFPVFWDVRNKMKLEELQRRIDTVGLARAGHMTMSRLTILERAG
ncbi:hypothetical protein LCL97_20950 [Seohaeicola saemankumensis]|nr:hypothetical protein [Seohaeicola saemankumensis]